MEVFYISTGIYSVDIDGEYQWKTDDYIVCDGCLVNLANVTLHRALRDDFQTFAVL